MIEQPLTIYFDLQPGTRPTLGAVGAAMIHFEKMAEEAVFLMEPGVEFSMVYQYSAPGSLRIIAGLRGMVTRERLINLTVAIVTLLAQNSLAYIQERGMDETIKAIIGEEESLSDDDIQRIADTCRNAERSEAVTRPRSELYRAIELENAITGIGAALNDKKERPAVVVPRSEFGYRSKKAILISGDVDPEQQVLTEKLEVVLANVPLTESKAKWNIVSKGHKISVKMTDTNFHKKLLSGMTKLKLASGVILDVTLQTTQVFENGVWKNIAYQISEVHSWRQDQEQAELLLTHGSNENNQNDQKSQ